MDKWGLEIIFFFFLGSSNIYKLNIFIFNMTHKEDIPEMDLNDKYSNKKIPKIESPEKTKKEMDNTKKDLEKIKDYIVKKYSYVQAVGILPPQSIKLFIDEEEVPKETEKYMHLIVIVPEDKYKKVLAYPKMK